MSNTPIHFEIPVDDMERATKFYKGLFDWDIKSAGDDFPDYKMVYTVPVDENQMPKEPGINGGMIKRSNASQQIMNYINVDDIDKFVNKAGELGGKVLMPKMPITGIGWNAVIQDTENNVFGLMQEDPNAV